MCSTLAATILFVLICNMMEGKSIFAPEKAAEEFTPGFSQRFGYQDSNGAAKERRVICKTTYPVTCKYPDKKLQEIKLEKENLEIYYIPYHGVAFKSKTRDNPIFPDADEPDNSDSLNVYRSKRVGGSLPNGGYGQQAKRENSKALYFS